MPVKWSYLWASMCHCNGFLLAVLYLALFVAISGCSGESPDANLPEYSIHYDPDRDPFADGRDAIELARSSNRRILIQVGGNWCGWCRALDRFQMSDAGIRRQLHDDFVVLKVNYSDENRNRVFLSAFPDIQGYPHIYISEKDGTVLHSQDTSKFVVDGKYSHTRFSRFLNRWKIP